MINIKVGQNRLYIYHQPMEIRDAFKLIETGAIKPEKQVWCDLGCGSGTFTLALAKLLPAESLIYAVDKDKTALDSIPQTYHQVNIQKYPADFVADQLPFANLDGILMANSLHFVREKISFIRKIEQFAKPDFQLLIVEYDNDTPNPWVPYPLSFQSLKKFFTQNGYFSIFKLNQRKSVYNSGLMYSALVTK